MTRSTRARAWRYASIVVVCGLPILLGAVVVDNLIDASEADTMAAREQTTLSQIVTQVARHRDHGLTERDKASLYLSSTTATLARAEVQERATTLVARAGGHLEEAQFVGTPEQEADGQVAIQLILQIDNKGLFDLLYDTETGLPLLDVTDLTVSRGEADAEGGAMPATGDGPMRVELTVRGHWRKVAG